MYPPPQSLHSVKSWLASHSRILYDADIYLICDDQIFDGGRKEEAIFRPLWAILSSYFRQRSYNKVDVSFSSSPRAQIAKSVEELDRLMAYHQPNRQEYFPLSISVQNILSRTSIMQNKKYILVVTSELPDDVCERFIEDIYLTEQSRYSRSGNHPHSKLYVEIFKWWKM